MGCTAHGRSRRCQPGTNTKLVTSAGWCLGECLGVCHGGSQGVEEKCCYYARVARLVVPQQTDGRRTKYPISVSWGRELVKQACISYYRIACFKFRYKLSRKLSSSFDIFSFGFLQQQKGRALLQLRPSCGQNLEKRRTCRSSKGAVLSIGLPARAPPRLVSLRTRTQKFSPPSSSEVADLTAASSDTGAGRPCKACMHATALAEIDDKLYPPSRRHTTRPPASRCSCLVM